MPILTNPLTNSTVVLNRAQPAISIITATFNASSQLPDLITSLRAQSDRDFEWIVIDGGSTDSTVELLHGCGDLVTSMVSEPDFGIYHAINKGIRLSRADYYLVVGADDRLAQHAIENFRSHSIRSKADIISAGISINGKVSYARSGRSWLHGMFAYVSGHSVCTLIRRNLHERFGEYSRRFPVAADMHFLKRVCQDPGTIVVRADFIAGEHGTVGISSTDKAATLCDCFRVQLETERGKLLQILIFVAKLLWRAPRIVAAARLRGTASKRRDGP